MSEHWPTYLQEGELLLRPLRIRDRRSWLRVRAANKDWLTEWEATLPQVPGEKNATQLPSFSEMVNWHRREGRNGRSYSLAIWHLNSQEGKEKGRNLIAVSYTHLTLPTTPYV